MVGRIGHNRCGWPFATKNSINCAWNSRVKSSMLGWNWNSNYIVNAKSYLSHSAIPSKVNLIKNNTQKVSPGSMHSEYLIYCFIFKKKYIIFTRSIQNTKETKINYGIWWRSVIEYWTCSSTSWGRRSYYMDVKSDTFHCSNAYPAE